MHTTKKRLIAVAAPVGLALALLAAPQAAHADYEGPTASFGTAGPNIAGSPTLFIAIETNGGDTRGLTFDYDFDGDGAYDLSTPDAAVDFTYMDVGVYNASLRVTDEFLLTDTVSIEVIVNDPAVLGPPLFPAEGAPPVNGVSLSTSTVRAGESVNLLFDGSAPESFGARLVVASSDDPWLSESTAHYGPFTSATAELPISATASPGKYKVLVVTMDNRMTALPLTIESPATGPTDLSSLPVIAGGSVLVLALIVVGIVFFRSRRKRTSSTVVEEEASE